MAVDTCEQVGVFCATDSLAAAENRNRSALDVNWAVSLSQQQHRHNHSNTRNLSSHMMCSPMLASAAHTHSNTSLATMQL